MKKCSFFGGVIVGSAIGAAIALLFAPQSGKKTREWLSKAQKDHEELIEETRGAAEELIYKTKKSIEDSIEKLAQTIDKKEHEASDDDREELI